MYFGVGGMTYFQGNIMETYWSNFFLYLTLQENPQIYKKTCFINLTNCQTEKDQNLDIDT